MAACARKPHFGISDQVQHKPGCTATEDGKRLKFLVDGVYYLCSENKCADQPRSNCAADLRLCFLICKKQIFTGQLCRVCNISKLNLRSVNICCLATSVFFPQAPVCIYIFERVPRKQESQHSPQVSS